MEKDQLAAQPSGQLTKAVAIGGSAGALTVVLQIIQKLRADLKVGVIIVLHRKASDDNVLLEVLSTRSTFEVREVDDKDEMAPGVIYIAPPDYHVLIEKDGTLTLDDSEKVNYSRPSIDVTFESAAEVYGNRLVSVLLSGANADGVAGLIRTKERGGKVVIQDPDSAEFSFMPRKATEEVDADLVLTDKNIDELIKLLRS